VEVLVNETQFVLVVNVHNGTDQFKRKNICRRIAPT